MRISLLLVLVLAAAMARAQFATPELVLLTPEGRRMATFDMSSNSYVDSVIVDLPPVARIRIDETNKIGYILGTNPVTDEGIMLRFRAADLLFSHIIPFDTLSFGIGHHPCDIAFIDTRRALVAFSEPAEVRAFTLSDRTLGTACTLPDIGTIRQMQRATKNVVAVCGGTTSGSVVMYDWTSDTIVSVLPFGAPVTQLELDRDINVHALAPGEVTTTIARINKLGTVDTTVVLQRRMTSLAVTVTIDSQYDRGLVSSGVLDDTVSQYDPQSMGVFGEGRFTALLCTGIGERILAVHNDSLTLYSPDTGSRVVERAQVPIPYASMFSVVYPVLPLVFDAVHDGSPIVAVPLHISPLPCRRGEAVRVASSNLTRTATCAVYDMLGRRADAAFAFSSGAFTIDTEHLVPGAYVIRAAGSAPARFLIVP